MVTFIVTPSHEEPIIVI